MVSRPTPFIILFTKSLNFSEKKSNFPSGDVGHFSTPGVSVKTRPLVYGSLLVSFFQWGQGVLGLSFQQRHRLWARVSTEEGDTG